MIEHASRGVVGGVAVASTGKKRPRQPDEEAIVLSSDSEQDDNGEAGGSDAAGMHHKELPHCPICLTDILDPNEKAILQPCFHIFCRPCVHRWLVRHKKLCPLCKGNVGSYIHSIESERHFKEEFMPPSPSRRDPQPSALHMGRGSSMRPIDDLRLDRHYSELRRTGGGGVGVRGGEFRHLVSRPRGHGGLLTDPRHAARRHHQDMEWPPRRHRGPQSPPETRSSSSGDPHSNPSGSREPRPYYWRVQRTCQRYPGPGQQQQLPSHPPPASSSSTADPVALPESPSPAQRAMLWRRRVYSEDLWAAGFERRPPPQQQGVDSVVQQQRLREWLMRELRAVLRNDDVSFLVMYFLGLWSSHHPEQGQQGRQPSASARSSSSSGSSARRPHCPIAEYLGRWGGAAEDAAEVLPSVVPFLGNHSRHFWHELRCFAISGLSVPAFDSVVGHVNGEEAAKQTETDAEGVVSTAALPNPESRHPQRELPPNNNPEAPASVPPSAQNASSPAPGQVRERQRPLHRSSSREPADEAGPAGTRRAPGSSPREPRQQQWQQEQQEQQHRGLVKRRAASPEPPERLRPSPREDSTAAGESRPPAPRSVAAEEVEAARRAVEEAFRAMREGRSLPPLGGAAPVERSAEEHRIHKRRRLCAKEVEVRETVRRRVVQERGRWGAAEEERLREGSERHSRRRQIRCREGSGGLKVRLGPSGAGARGAAASDAAQGRPRRRDSRES